MESLRLRAEAAEHNEREIRKHLACRIEAADRAHAERDELFEYAIDLHQILELDGNYPDRCIDREEGARRVRAGLAERRADAKR
jgi:hypothetical protein